MNLTRATISSWVHINASLWMIKRYQFMEKGIKELLYMTTLHYAKSRRGNLVNLSTGLLPWSQILKTQAYEYLDHHISCHRLPACNTVCELWHRQWAYFEDPWFSHVESDPTLPASRAMHQPSPFEWFLKLVGAVETQLSNRTFPIHSFSCLPHP